MSEINNYPVSSPEELQTLVERNRSNNWPDLPVNKRAFAHEYIVNYKHRAAAKKSGFSQSAGMKLLRDPLVAAYIEYLQTLQLTNNIITKDFINAHLMQLLEMAMGEEDMHMVTADGSEYKGRKTLVGEANNILKEMAKSTDYVKDTGNKTAPVSVSINFGRLFRNTGGDSVGVDDSVIIDVSPEEGQ